MTTPALALVQPEPSQPGGGLAWDDYDPGFKLADGELEVDFPAFEEARCRMRITRATVCDRAHVPHGAWWWLEHGRYRTIEPVMKLARALSLTPAEAFK